MDLRELMTKLNRIAEEGEYDIEAGKKLNQAKWNFANKQNHLYGLLQQLRSLVNQSSASPQQPSQNQSVFGPDGKITGMPPPVTPKVSKWDQDVAAQKGLHANMQKLAQTSPAGLSETISIKESLVSSFGYKIPLNEEGPGWIAIITACYDAITKLQELPTDLPNDQYRSYVYKIVAEVVAIAGVSWVGALIGGWIAGLLVSPTGVLIAPAAVVGMIAGGTLAPYYLGNDIEKIVDKVVDFLNPAGAAKEPSDQDRDSPDESEFTDAEVDQVAVELQTKLKEKGFDVGVHGVDGVIGKDTIAALQAYKQKINAASDLDAMISLLGISGVNESTYTDQIIQLRNKLSKIDEGAAWADDLLAKIGIATASRKLADALGRNVEIPAKVRKGVVKKPAQRFERVGNDYINPKTGQKLSAEDIQKAGGKPVEAITGAPPGSAYASPDGKLRYQKDADGKWYNIKAKGDKVEVTDQNTVKELEARSAQPHSSTETLPQSAPLGKSTTPGTTAGIASDIKPFNSHPNPKINAAFEKAKAVGGKVSGLLKNNKGKLLLAALALGGWYFKDNIGNLITQMTPSTSPDTQGGTTTPAQGQEQPTQGATSTPAQGTAQGTANQNLQTLVRDIKLDINDLKLMSTPEIQADIHKVIKHAEDTLRMYAPNM